MSKMSARTPWMKGLAGVVMLGTVLALGAVPGESSERGFGSPGTQDPGASARPLALVNGEVISSLDLESELREAATSGTVEMPSADALLRRMIENRLLEQEGYLIGVDQYPEVAGQVRSARRLRGISALLDSVAAAVPPIPDEVLDANFSQVNIIRHPAHILVADEATARAMVDSLNQGVEFRGLAIRNSIDASSAVKGGDLGWNREGAFVAEFEQALEELEVGEISPPVQTEFGWHVIELIELREETIGQNEAMIAALKEEMQRQNRTRAIQRFVADLRVKYEVQIDRETLASMDFVDTDVKVVRGYSSRTEVVVSTSRAQLTVQELYREILFKHFHGITGKPEANAIRDKMLEDWVDEAVLSFEAVATGMIYSPGVEEFIDVMERRLIREQMVDAIGRAKANATEEQVAQFYRENLALFCGPSRIKLSSVLLEDEAAAISFRKGIEDGAEFSWLAKRAAGVRETNPKDLSGWVRPGSLGLEPNSFAAGDLLGPLLVDDKWIVGQVISFEAGEPLPYDECRPAVEARLERRLLATGVTEALDRLEETASVEILDGSSEFVTAWLDEYERRAQVEKETGRMPAHGGL